MHIMSMPFLWKDLHLTFAKLFCEGLKQQEVILPLIPCLERRQQELWPPPRHLPTQQQAQLSGIDMQ
jgi:hypothetical protein